MVYILILCIEKNQKVQCCQFIMFVCFRKVVAPTRKKINVVRVVRSDYSFCKGAKPFY
jgi:Pyruvate/2-oxoacid:ferredoxin oxidoreductase delta subunit